MNYLIFNKNNLEIFIQDNGIRFHSNKLWNTENDALELELKNKVQDCIANKNYEIWISPENESKLFIPLDYISFRTSFGFSLLVTILKGIIILLLLPTCIIYFNRIKRKYF